MNKYTHIGKLFYFDADIPSDVKEVQSEIQGMRGTFKKILWRFYWLSNVEIL